MVPSVLRHLLLPVLAVAVLAAPSAAEAGASNVRAPNPKASWSATVLAPVTARRHPTFRGKSVMTLQPIAPLGGGSQTLLVRRTARDRDGRLWVRLQLPKRPNGSQGWVPADALRFRKSRLRLVINQRARKITLFRNNKKIFRADVAVGEAITPTPGGKFAVAEMIRTNAPGNFLGPIVFPLTGYSRVLNEYAGGNGRVAIHGTSLPELIGTRASHGCIRMRNRDVVRLSRLVRSGTPVRILKP